MIEICYLLLGDIEHLITMFNVIGIIHFLQIFHVFFYIDLIIKELFINIAFNLFLKENKYIAIVFFGMKDKLFVDFELS